MQPYYDADGVTIYHADSFEILHDIEGIGAVITDPPYSSGGQFRGDRTRSTSTKYVQGTKAYRPEFAGDNRDQRSYLAWCSLWMAAAHRACVPSAPFACFTDWRQLPTTTAAVQIAGWTWRGIATWTKGYGRVNAAGFSAAAEFVVWSTNGPAGKGGEAHDYPPGTFDCLPERGESREHVAQKPEPVMAWLMRIAPAGALVLDPFMGSGSTLRAAKASGRPSIGIDCDERYCEMAARRLEATEWGAAPTLPLGDQLELAAS